MITRQIRRSTTTALLLMAAVLAALAVPGGVSHAAVAQPAAICERVNIAALAPTCVLDQLQWLSVAPAVNFGGTTSLGQTFVPHKRGPVCQVSVKMRRNVTAGAGAVRMRVLRPDNSLVDTAWRTAAQIPPGDSIQTFDFGCDGQAVGDARYFGLVLDATTSTPAAYGWYGIGGNPYPDGAAYQNPGAGWMLLGGWDFTFKLLMCA